MQPQQVEESIGFLEATFQLLFGESSTIPTLYTGEEIPVFAVATGIVGFVVIFADLLVFKVKGRSLLNLGYAGLGPSLMVVVLWGIGSGIAALLGVWSGVFQMDRSACLAVGVGWPAIVPRLIQAAEEKEPLQQATQGGI